MKTSIKDLERCKELLMKMFFYIILTKMQEVVLFYNGLDVPTRQILNLRGAIPSKTAADAKPYKHNSNLEEKSRSMKIVYGAQVGCEQGKGHPLHQRLYHSREEGKLERSLSTLNLVSPFHGEGYRAKAQENIRGSMDQILKAKLLKLHYHNLYTQEDKNGSYGPPFSEAYSYGTSHINKSIPRKEKDPGSFTLPCYINNVCFDNALADLGDSVSVMPLSTYLNLGLGELAHTKLIVELADRTVKYPKGIAENVLVGLRERMELDLEARLMGETLVLNRLLDPFFEDYIELNDLNVPFKLRRDQVDDLMPTIEEGEVIEEFRARNDARMVSKNFGYPSDCDHNKKIHIDYMMSKKFYNSIRKDKLDYKGNNVVGALMNIPIFVGTFSILTYFMDAYRDKGMGDDLAEKKSTMLVENLRSGNLEVLES
ncbi:mitochondrial proton/calcium exchanger protein-like protein isoform X1 [Tanacetum coccineum]